MSNTEECHFFWGPTLASNPAGAFAANARPAEFKPVAYNTGVSAEPSANDIAAERRVKFEELWANHVEVDINGTLTRLGLPTLEEAYQREDTAFFDQAALDSGAQAVGGAVEYPADSQYL